jgi:hypothetical protein
VTLLSPSPRILLSAKLAVEPVDQSKLSAESKDELHDKLDEELEGDFIEGPGCSRYAQDLYAGLAKAREAAQLDGPWRGDEQIVADAPEEKKPSSSSKGGISTRAK